MSERWRPIVGYEGVYEISDFGRVRRCSGGQGAIVGRVLTCKRGTAGYLHVDLSIGDQKTRFLIHRLVATAFIGPRPSDSHEVNHRDAVKTNNAATNLEWLTRQENIAHAGELGLYGGRPLPGSSNGRAKLTDFQVAEIRSLKGIVGARRLAERFGVSRSAIQFIHQGKHWK